MKKSNSFTFACLLGGGALLVVVLPGCETHPPAPYLGGRTEYISSGNGGTSGSNEAGTPVSVRRQRTPAPSPERVATRHPKPLPAKTPSASPTPAKPKPAGVESEVQDPSDLKTDDTTRQKKKGSDKKPMPAKVDAEIPNPSDLH